MDKSSSIHTTSYWGKQPSFMLYDDKIELPINPEPTIGKFTTVEYYNGHPVNELTPNDLVSMIQDQQEALDNLKEVEFESTFIEEQKKKCEANIKRLIELLDAHKS